MKSIRRLALLCSALWLGATAHAQLNYLPSQGSNGTTGTTTSTGTTGNASSGRATDGANRVLQQDGTGYGQAITPQLGNATNAPQTSPDEGRPGITRRPQDGRVLIDPRTGMLQPLRAPLTTEFSRYASRLVGEDLPVFGADFFSRLTPEASAAAPAIPPDYLVNVGDELLIQINGPVEAEIRQQVRRGGDITLPKVGAVRVAGVAASELATVLRARLESQFRGIQVSATLVSLRGMRVFVTGFVAHPGPVVVDSLSTVISAIAAAGGPDEGGSTRIAELWRKGRKIASFDIYRFLIQGDTSGDRSLTADDVIRVLPTSPIQIALTGSVNRPGVYEMMPGETLKDLFEFAGGLTPVADRRRLGVVELDRDGTRNLQEVPLDATGNLALTPGAVMQVFALASLSQPVKASAKIVHVEGEVNKPGSYVLPAGATLADALRAASGITEDAHPSSIVLIRPELARQQQQQLSRSLDELEKSVYESLNTSVGSGGSQAETSAAIASNTRAYIERIRAIKPVGRLILARDDTAGSIPPLLLNGDRILVPHKPQSVSIFGAVYGEGSYQATAALPLGTVIANAGGVRPGADEESIVIMRHDGSFAATRKGWFESRPEAAVAPGDTVFVPTDAQRGRSWAIMRDIGTMVYQFGLGVAALKALN